MATAASQHRWAWDAVRRKSLVAPADVEPTDTAALMHAAQRGDREALIQLVRSLQDVWFRFAWSMLGDEHLARDAAQETALRFVQRLAQFRGDSSVRTWSLGIALNVTRELRRKRGDTSQAETAERAADRPGPAQSAEHAEACGALHVAMAMLSDRQREAVVLRYFEQRSVAEIAVLMDCAAGTVKATLAQSLRHLRKHWSDDDEL
jgi:RNA polymerase sigma-70 factor (ECF subfamily)